MPAAAGENTGTSPGVAGLAARPESRAALWLPALMLVHHFGLWAWTAFHRGFPLLQGLERWDSAHLTLWRNHRVTHGFVIGLWAY